MDLNQRKLTKSEWNSIEKPVSEEEKEVLKIILQGFHNVSIRYNKHNSLFGYLKIEYGEAMEDYLYNKYFAERILAIKTKYEIENVFNIISKSNPSIKKADLIRIEKNSSEKIKGANVFEYLLIEIIENIYKTRSELSLSAGIGKTWLVHYFTLYKLIRVNIPRINRHISLIVANVLNTLETEMNMYEVISNAVEFIEKNSLLLKYDDISLYEHQKELFALMKQNTSSLTLYIAPTGTGKTLSPIGLSEKYKVIFVCAARHVGLALARSAIALNKKIAFAFGCSSADEIRLHYYSAKEFTVNKRSGGIGKVDNSVGDKVETMISAKIADGVTRTKHDKGREMLGLGIANIVTGLCGGIPATAALARTSLNIKTGCNDKISATISSICIGLISFLLLTFVCQLLIF